VAAWWQRQMVLRDRPEAAELTGVAVKRHKVYA